MLPDLWFAVPGNLDTLTGGYIYDRRLLTNLRALGLEVRHLPLPRSFPHPASDDLAATAAQFSALPDDAVVLVDGLAFGAMPEIAEREARRLRLVALCHHPLALETGLDAAAVERLTASERRALHAARGVIVTSHETARCVNALFDIPKEHIVVALPGTDSKPLAECAGDPPLLLTVASLTRRKAHDVLIAALAQIRHLPWQARFVGGAQLDPAWSAALRAQTEAAHLSERIAFVGERQDLDAEYAAADVFVLPSRFEGYGMVFSEALAAGLPIVAARAGAVPEVVPADAGVLVPPDDAAALANALEQLLTQPSLRTRLQEGARRAALQLPRWEDSAHIVLSYLQAVRI